MVPTCPWWFSLVSGLIQVPVGGFCRFLVVSTGFLRSLLPLVSSKVSKAQLVVLPGFLAVSTSLASSSSLFWWFLLVLGGSYFPLVSPSCSWVFCIDFLSLIHPEAILRSREPSKLSSLLKVPVEQRTIPLLFLPKAGIKLLYAEEGISCNTQSQH